MVYTPTYSEEDFGNAIIDSGVKYILAFASFVILIVILFILYQINKGIIDVS